MIKGQTQWIYYIKRVIATQGDLVDLTQNGEVMVNGKHIAEPYTGNAPTVKHDIPFLQTVPSGRIFVLGDNRTVSRDSRNSAIGMIPQNNVMGTFICAVSR